MFMLDALKIAIDQKIINDLKNHPLTSKGLILKDISGAIILIRGDKNLKLLEIEEIMNF